MVFFEDLEFFMKKILLTFVLIATLLIPVGCAVVTPLAGVAGGAVNATIFWYNNEGRKYYEYDAATIHKSALQSLEKLGQPVTSNTLTEIKAGIKDRFKVKIEETQPNITLLKVRMNTLGDKEMGELFFKYVDDQLNVVQFGPPSQNTPTQPKPARRRFTR
jgi:hypothetical protein